MESNQAEKDLGISEGMFNAYIRGNVRFPQDGFGISAYVAYQVFIDNVDLLEFSQSHLSDEQVQKIIGIMHKMHAHHGVGVATETEGDVVLDKIEDKFGARPSSEGIFRIDDMEERIYGLWLTAAGGATYIIHKIINNVVLKNFNKSEEDPGSELLDLTLENFDNVDSAISIRNFLSGDNGQEGRETIFNVLRIIFESLNSNDIEELVSAYKKLHSLHGRSIRTKEFPTIDEYDEMYDQNERSNVIKKQILEKVYLKVKEVYPDLEWDSFYDIFDIFE